MDRWFHNRTLFEKLASLHFHVPQSVIDSWTEEFRIEVEAWADDANMAMTDTIDWYPFKAPAVLAAFVIAGCRWRDWIAK